MTNLPGEFRLCTLKIQKELYYLYSHMSLQEERNVFDLGDEMAEHINELNSQMKQCSAYIDIMKNNKNRMSHE